MAVPNEAIRAAGDPSIEAAVSLRGVKIANERFALGPIHCDIPQGYVTAINGTD